MKSYRVLGGILLHRIFLQVHLLETSGVHTRTDDLSARMSTEPVAITFSEPHKEFVAIKFRDDVGCERMFIRRECIVAQARTYASDIALS
jgi:hypothetical protein